MTRSEGPRAQCTLSGDRNQGTSRAVKPLLATTESAEAAGLAMRPDYCKRLLLPQADYDVGSGTLPNRILCHPMRPGNTRGSGRRADAVAEHGHLRPERMDEGTGQARLGWIRSGPPLAATCVKCSSAWSGGGDEALGRALGRRIFPHLGFAVRYRSGLWSRCAAPHARSRSGRRPGCRRAGRR
jgi:hypothetical protein